MMPYVHVEMDWEEIDDDALVAEYESRGLGREGREGHEGHGDEMLTRIWIADREGRKDEAYALMREYVLDKLNKVV
jgi:hypothetical protein